jgi:hypothetical protein
VAFGGSGVSAHPDFFGGRLVGDRQKGRFFLGWRQVKTGRRMVTVSARRIGFGLWLEIEISAGGK